MGMLTVRENIAFSAALRLPNSVSNKEKSQRVSELIEDLGLTKCADTKVCLKITVKYVLVYLQISNFLLHSHTKDNFLISSA